MFPHGVLNYHDAVRLDFKLAVDLGSVWTRSWGILGAFVHHVFLHCMLSRHWYPEVCQ